jgi:hypothetical protein
MHNKTFNFEIRDLLTQFIAAMDDVVISRYNKDREEKEKIKVRYIHAPKERVFYDLVNKAQNITLPVISVNITGIQRDETRVFNKIDGFYEPVRRDTQSKLTSHVAMPVPVNLSVAVSIITNYQSDLEQIISNFVPYSNPYIVISWNTPESFKINNIEEIRSEVLWDGNIQIEYPTDIESSSKPRFSGNTTFTIKGWLFPSADKDYYKNIYFVNNHFRLTEKYNLNYDLLSIDLSAINAETLTENVYISGAPLISNLYLTKEDGPFELSGKNIVIGNKNKFIIFGQNLQYTTSIILSGDSSNLYTNLTSLSYSYYPPISGYVLPKENYSIMNKNAIHLNLPSLNNNSNINIIISNDIGWKDTNSINTQMYYISSI